MTKLSSARRCEEIVYDQAVSCEEIASGQAVSCEEIVSGHAVPCEEIMFVCVFVCVCKFVFFSSTNDDSRKKALASPASPTYFSRSLYTRFAPDPQPVHSIRVLPEFLVVVLPTCVNACV